MTDLAKRWMESKHWGGWRRGMVDEYGDVVHDTWPDGSFCTSELVDGDDWHRTPERATHEAENGLIPDLTHPGTLAFLLEDVRAAWGASVRWESGPNGHHVVMKGYQWFNPGKCVGKGDTEAAALIAALEAAP